MVFPLLGAGDIGSHFGADRDGGRRYHMGNDLFAPKLQPVVAVADGTVTRIAGDSGISGYRVHVRHDDGWSSLYIHLNNDTAGTDDGNGIGIRPDLREGDRVEAGEIIGWNGDSGNAETTPSHLHFELRDPAGDSVDPQPSLEAAERLSEPFAGPFADLATDEEEPSSLAVLLSRGVPVWCDSPERVCPDTALTADRLHVWAAPFGTGLEACEADCPRVTQADIARRVAWESMNRTYQRHAAWLDQGVPDSMWTTPPPAPPSSPDDLDLSTALAALGGTRRCLAPPNDSRELSTMDAATAFAIYMGWDQVPGCFTNSENR